MTDKTWDVELVELLGEFSDPNNPNREVLAHLRRGLDQPIDYTLARIGWLFRRVPDEVLDDAILVAGLFAWTKGRCPQAEGINFGEAFGAGLSQDEKEQREKRFIDLLDTDTKELPYKLRQAITLVARADGELDWRMLRQHMSYWNHPDRWVQKKWARGFWRITAEEPTSETNETVSV